MLSHPTSTNTQRLSRPPCILAIEDDEDNLLVAGYVVEKLNCRFLKATDSMTALSIAHSHLPDLIILDMILPDFDGFYFMNQLKQNPLTAHIPVIAVTGLVYADSQQQIQQAGCVDYLSKPYLLEDLESCIVRHLCQFSFASSPVLAQIHEP